MSNSSNCPQIQSYHNFFNDMRMYHELYLPVLLGHTDPKHLLKLELSNDVTTFLIHYVDLFSLPASNYTVQKNTDV